jgi:hypothetical protein
MRRPHPVFWLALVILAAAVVVAATVGGRAPGYALNSGVVYRLEVALAVLLGAYSACSLLLLAYAGRPLQRFELPGGAVAEASAEPLGQAATDFAAFRDAVLAQLEELDQTLGDLDARLAELESDGR